MPRPWRFRQGRSTVGQALPLLDVRFSYDAASRLQTVSQGTDSATYSYLANSPLVEQIVFTHSGTTRMTTSKNYDTLNRLLRIRSADGSGQPIVSFDYSYNAANQRTSVTNADGSRWVYSYDKLGQVISGKKYWADGTPVAGQQFEYAFDDIGNRKTNKFGGDATGAHLRTALYSVNDLNQSTSRTVPGYVTFWARRPTRPASR